MGKANKKKNKQHKAQKKTITPSEVSEKLEFAVTSDLENGTLEEGRMKDMLDVVSFAIVCLVYYTSQICFQNRLLGIVTVF